MGLGKPFSAIGQKKQERSYRVDRNVPVFVKCGAKVRCIPENGKCFFQDGDRSVAHTGKTFCCQHSNQVRHAFLVTCFDAHKDINPLEIEPYPNVVDTLKNIGAAIGIIQCDTGIRVFFHGQ